MPETQYHCLVHWDAVTASESVRGCPVHGVVRAWGLIALGMALLAAELVVGSSDLASTVENFDLALAAEGCNLAQVDGTYVGAVADDPFLSGPGVAA
mmetsp:Transcript_7509/g.13163  ORF Transcript_7509/g.13163 Transcript_7509/m.13163 type:complete len:97 (+) Transcript_7509:415-705(+)